MLHFVENTDQVIENIKTIERYLNSEVEEEKQFAQDLIKKGRSMLIYKVNGQNHFAPIRFLGFKKNSQAAHIENENRESRDTAPAIQSLMGKPFTHDVIEKEFNDNLRTNFLGWYANAGDQKGDRTAHRPFGGTNRIP